MLMTEAMAAAPGVELECVPCAICGSDEGQELFWDRDRQCGKPGRFRVVKCRDCSLVYLNPRPTRRALEAFYASDYPVYQVPLGNRARAVSLARAWAKAWAARWYSRGLRFDPMRIRDTLLRVADFPPYFPFGFFPTMPGGRLLDLGCGSGNYLHAFQRLGWEAYGVDNSPLAAEQVRKTFGLKVITGELEETNFPDGYFDVITLIHVLEHLRDPVGTLQEVSRILARGGLILLALPNVRSLPAWVFGSHWFALDVPRHLYHFSPATLRHLLRKVDGIRPVRVNHVPVTEGLTESCAYLCQDSPRFRRFLPRRVTSLLAPPLAWAIALGRLSDSIVVYAKKEP